MDSALNIVGISLGVLGCVLLLHVTLPPMLHRRALVWRGTEMMLATIALLAAVVTQWWPGVVVIPVILVIAFLLGPWVVWGVGADRTLTLAKRAASMVRVRFEPDPQDARRVRVGNAVTLRAFAMGPRITLLILTGTRTPKVKLWRNVFRKQAANVDLRVS